MSSDSGAKREIARDMDGLPFPSGFPEENYHLMRNLPLRDNDIVLLTYPKCGTNWTAYIIYCMLHPEEMPPDGHKVQRSCAFVDLVGLGVWKVSPEQEGRILLTHIRPDRIQMNSRTKFVGVVRNPLDCCVSYFHFLKDLYCTEESGREPQGVPDRFYEEFLDGTIAYGDFFLHLEVLYDRRNDENFHLIAFEEMKLNPRRETLRLARFLGLEDNLQANGGELLDKIVNLSSFSAMKENVKYSSRSDSTPVEFLRKGEVGSYRESLTTEQIKHLKEKMMKELRNSELLDLWKDV